MAGCAEEFGAITMDQRERIADVQEGIRAAMIGFAASLWTAMPGIIQSYNAAQGTVTVQPAIKAFLTAVNPSAATPSEVTGQSFVDMPVLLDVPVVYLGGGGFVATFPIAAGDECLVIFASRCIDLWWKNGGIQEQAELRMHDLSDGFALVGPRSLPKAIPSASGNTAQLRSMDGSTYIEIAAGGVVNIKAPGGLNVNGNTIVTGTVTASDEIKAKNTHTVSAHVHGGVQTGGGTTGPPTG